MTRWGIGMAAALSLLLANAAPAGAADAKAGKDIFSRCAACHTISKGGANGLGPNLFGVVGRKTGSKPDYGYSAAMKNAGFSWTPQKLDAYIAHPAAVVPGNRMAFAGIPDAKQRSDLIAYLSAQK